MNKKRAVRLVFVLSIFLISDSCLSHSCSFSSGIEKYDGEWKSSDLPMIVPVKTAISILEVKEADLVFDSSHCLITISGKFYNGTKSGQATIDFNYHENIKKLGHYLMGLADATSIITSSQIGIKTLYGTSGTQKQMFFTIDEMDVNKNDSSNKSADRLDFLVSNPPTMLATASTYNKSQSEEDIDSKVKTQHLSFVHFDKVH